MPSAESFRIAKEATYFQVKRLAKSLIFRPKAELFQGLKSKTAYNLHNYAKDYIKY